jgi:MbnP
MKKIAILLSIVGTMVSCNNNDDSSDPIAGCMDENSLNFNAQATTDDGSCEYPSVDFTFTQNWDGSAIQNADFDVTEYTNAHGEVLTLSKLVYLISDITFTNAAGDIYSAGDYNLINVRDGQNLTFTPNVTLPLGDYTVSFTFGFDDEDNARNYPDLNSADGGWNVPLLLGGGYHYMRMEGKYTSGTVIGEVNFQYHTIRAADNSTTPITLTDTSFHVDLGQITIGENTQIEIKMNVAEWFKNPNTWDLTQLYTMLMPNYDAQIMMSENGAGGVFSLGTVTQ